MTANMENGDSIIGSGLNIKDSVSSDLYIDTISGDKQTSINKSLQNIMNQMPNTKRKVNRPEISLLNGVLAVFLFIIIYPGSLIIAYIIAKQYKFSYAALLIIINIITFMVIQINLKRSIIYLVKIYQKYAPEDLRRSCVYTPSCSEYMIGAVEKHGPYAGLYFGLKRLFRCHYPNGGIDYP